MLKFTDWQISNLERNVERIYNASRIQNKNSWVNLMMMALSLFAIVLACDWTDGRKPYNITLICFAASVVVIYIVTTFIVPLCQSRRDIKKERIQISKYVDLFDDKVCKYIMQAKSFEREATSVSGTEQLFYYSQMSYYAGKAINCLVQTSIWGDKVYTRNMVSSRVSFRRLVLVCKLIKECRNGLDAALKSDTTGLKDEAYETFQQMELFFVKMNDPTLKTVIGW